jgi:hypothetical protein
MMNPLVRSAAVALCLSSLACSSTKTEGSPSAATGPKPGADSGSPATGTGSTPGATTPCGLNTGFAGDDLCILPPDPAAGFQLHYGPTGYTDPAALAPFLLAPGAEQTDCFYAKTPNDKEVFLSVYHSRMRPGSHHLIIDAVDTVHPDGFGPCEQATGPGVHMLGGSSTLKRDFPDIVAPENEGLGMKLAPHSQISLNLHYINSTDKPILREQWVNFLYKDAATVTTLESPVFHLAGILSSIAPHTTKITQGLNCTAPADLRIVELHGHYHSHTVRNSAWRITPGGQKTLIYESFDWHEPASLEFDSAHTNPPSDPVAKTAGGVSGTLEFKKGDTLAWECEVVNNDSWALPFTNQVDKGEMCIMSGFYAPSTGSTWSCTTR